MSIQPVNKAVEHLINPTAVLEMEKKKWGKKQKKKEKKESMLILLRGGGGGGGGRGTLTRSRKD